MKKFLLGSVALVALATAGTANAADMAPIRKAPPPPVWSWTGLYIGAHSGAIMAGITHFSDPFGSPIYGDRVRTPGWLFGGQIGYNWQDPNSPWVWGVEADISGLDSDGTNTCFAVSGNAINTTCRVRPDVSGTFTGRVGYATGPQDRTLLYVKGGLAWAHSKIDMATNNAIPALLPITANSSSYTVWGGTVGAGAEYAMTPAWSLKLEYDYLGFARSNVANLGSVTMNAAGAIVAVVPPGTAGVRQDLHEFKVGVNYKWGADPWAAWPSGPAYPVKAPVYKAPPVAAWTPGWELEVGGRYVYSWSRFQYDLGQLVSSGLPPISAVSRLTYNDMKTDSGEIFGRIDTPWNWFIKGFAGSGKIRGGSMTDEDFGIPVLGFVPYSNTISPKVDRNSKYATVDVGYDWLRGPTYKAAGFVGYNYFEQHMFAHGCIQIANPNNNNCIPPVPVTDPGGITQDNKWKSLRVGVAGEFMPYERVKLSGEVAYLPYVKFEGVDHHLFLGSGALASENPQSGHGRGVQLEGLVSYLVTPNFSLGVGGRYWAMWTTDAQFTRTINCTAPGVCAVINSPPQFLKAAVEQASIFVQASVKFDSLAPISAKY